MRIWHQSFTDLDMVPLYRRTLVEHAAKVSDPGVSVTVHGLKPGTYGPHVAPIDAIRHPYLEMLNERQLIEAALTAEREGYDAMALACFYDPGIRAARSLVDIPIAGLSETAMLTACSLGQRFALIALNKDQQAQHEALHRHHGGWLAGWILELKCCVLCGAGLAAAAAAVVAHTLVVGFFGRPVGSIELKGDRQAKH